MERLPKNESENNDEPTGDQRVQNSVGEWVVLDYKPGKGCRKVISVKSLELKIQKEVARTVNHLLPTLYKKFITELEKKLKDKGLL